MSHNILNMLDLSAEVLRSSRLIGTERVYITNIGKQGIYEYDSEDTSTPDDDTYVFVDLSGRRYKKVTSSLVGLKVPANELPSVFLRLDGSTAMTGTLNLGNNKITNIELQTSNDPLQSAVTISRNELNNSVSRKPVGLRIENSIQTAGGTGYQNEIIIQLKAGQTSTQRRYIEFLDYDESVSGYFGINGLNNIVLYNAKNVVHAFSASNTTLTINSADTGAVEINNNYYDTEPNTGKGGLKIYDGVSSRLQFFSAVNGQTLLGYETVSIAGYNLLVGGKTYSGAQRGAIAIVDPLTPANYTTFYGVRVFNPASITSVQVIAFMSDVTAGTSRYGVYCSGTAISRFNGSIGIGGESFGGGTGVFFIANSGTVPSSNPSGGGVMYVEGGALKYRGSSGTVTTLGPA